MRTVDELTLRLIATALPRSSLDLGMLAAAIEVNKKSSGLTFRLGSGETVEVSVTQDAEQFYFHLSGGNQASIRQDLLLGKVH